MKSWRLCLLAFAVLFRGTDGFAQDAAKVGSGGPPELFERSADEMANPAVRVRREALGLKPGRPLWLNVRPGAASYEACVTSSADTRLGGHIVRGRIKDVPGGSFLVATHGSATAASVWVSPTERWTLDGETLREELPSSQIRCACAADATPARTLARSPVAAGTNRAAAAAAAGSAEFDVLVVYTPAALQAEGSADAVAAQAELAMADANVCYQNSGIPIHGNIVGVRAVDYSESGEIRTDLHRLAVPGDGFLDEVQAMRDAVQADMVCLFTNRASADGYNGYAEILTVLRPDGEELGFSVVNVKQAVVDHLFAHELGHNMGCDHDRENTTGLRLFPFSYGWRFTGTDGHLYRDVMAYPPGDSIPYFASPLVSYAGTPTGVADYADTARTLVESAPVFSNFRPADGRARVSVRASAAEASATGKSDALASFRFERTGSTAAPLTVSYGVDGTAPAGTSYQTLPGTLTFPAGNHFARQTVAGLADAAPFGAGTVGLTIQPGDAYVAVDDPLTSSATGASFTLYDRLPLVSLGAVSAPAGGERVRFVVHRLGHTDASLTVGYALRGSATAGIDYRAPSGEITFAAGSDSAIIKVRLLAPAAGSPAGNGRTLAVRLRPRAGRLQRGGAGHGGIFVVNTNRSAGQHGRGTAHDIFSLTSRDEWVNFPALLDLSPS